MNEAWERLCAVGGWFAITQGGPQRLPESSGGVTAFKFRDPDGHPLELLAFPAGNTPPRWQEPRHREIFLGIDHSAICVTDTAVSRVFYEHLGFKVSARSQNCGPEQERLDAVLGARVEVTALAPLDTGPHVELLCYHAQTRRPSKASKANDIAATRLVLELCGSPAEGDGYPRNIQDPDAHQLTIIPAISVGRGPDDA
jgi:catechol 2,3-dioxygenase-like lactoylglutathione lyase family enzyme